MVGVWIDPVTAQVMMTLPERAIHALPRVALARRPVDPASYSGPISAVLADEVTHLRIDLPAPAAAVEDAVMADAELDILGLLRFRQASQQPSGSRGLTDAANIVVLAFDQEDGGAGYGAWLDQAAARHEGAMREVAAVEDTLDRLQVEIRRQIHHRRIFVIEFLRRLGARLIALDEMAEEIEMRRHMTSQIHAQKSGKL